jgi:zinc protease
MKVNSKLIKNKRVNFLSAFCLLIAFLILPFSSFAQTPQETPPPPGKPSSVNIPAVKESKLKNGLPIVVVERKNVPLVTIRLLIKAGAKNENTISAGLADMTASLLTKGTKTRSATQIAEEIEFLGGSINSGADWNSSQITINVTSDKLEQALAILADTVLNPTFEQKEIDLYKQQVLDNLSVALKQPGTLGNYVASRYSFSEHNSNGTPETIEQISREGIVNFHNVFYKPYESVLIVTGDVSQTEALKLSKKYFEKWKNTKIKASNSASINESPKIPPKSTSNMDKKDLIKSILVIDLPDSGQASVSFATKQGFGRSDENNYYSSSVLNSLLGGGYSSRLNQEIRIKRGLSYGAGSNFGYRQNDTNFIASTQTKNESAAEVAELIKIEIEKLANDKISNEELTPRQAVLTGGFGRSLETNNGLAARISDLYLFGLKTSELNNYMESVRKVSGDNINSFANKNLEKGDIIIVGDASIFMDDLKKRFPNQTINVISVNDLDLNSANLRKRNDKMAKPKMKSAPAKGKSDADRNKDDN